MLACLLVQMLNRIGVELLVLPAVPELMDTWRGAFGFQPLNIQAESYGLSWDFFIAQVFTKT
jgi:hypothetical protein